MRVQHRAIGLEDAFPKSRSLHAYLLLTTLGLRDESVGPRDYNPGQYITHLDVTPSHALPAQCDLSTGEHSVSQVWQRSGRETGLPSAATATHAGPSVPPKGLPAFRSRSLLRQR